MQSYNHRSIDISMQDYIHKIKPISIDKGRRAQPNELCTEKEKRAFRSLIGAMQWPAAQQAPHVSASISFLQAKGDGTTVEDLLEANKTLRFLKSNGDLKLHFEDIGPLSSWRIGVYTDASWAS